MKRLLKTLFVFVLISGGFACAPATDPADFEESIAFVDVTVLPMDSQRTLSGHTVVVRGDRIVEVGPSESVEAPANALVIEGEGRHLLPGLAEMHGHIPPPDAPEEYVENVFFLYVSNGVTTVRGMLGAPGQLEVRDRVRSGEWIGPTLYLAGPSFSGQTIQSPEESEARVLQQKEEGWDLLKIHPGLTRDEYDAMARTAKEVGIDFAGHVPQEVGILHALESGQRTIDHLDGYMEYFDASDFPLRADQLRPLVEKTLEAGAGVVPTMALWETILGVPTLEKLVEYPELQYMPERILNNWKEGYQRRRENPPVPLESAERIVEGRNHLLKEMQATGVEILFGTDAPQFFSVPGFSIHREIAVMREAGLSPYEILKSGTAAIGVYFAESDTFGLVQPGHRADLILTEGNPLEDLSALENPAGVMVRGAWLSRAEIDERLAQIAGASR